MLRVHIYDPDGNPIIDGEPVGNRITGLNWSTLWPKGYGPLGAQFKRDILTRNPVYAGCKVVARWNGRSVYEGRLASPQQSLNGADGSAALNAHGWYTLLVERALRKRWIDLNAIGFLETPAARLTDGNQTRATIVFSDRQVKIVLVPDDVDIGVSTQAHLEYVLPVGTVRRVLYDYSLQSGQGLSMILHNDDQATDEDVTTVTQPVALGPTSGAVNCLFAAGSTGSFTLKVAPPALDEYDQNDWTTLIDLAVHANYHPSHSAVALPTYTTDEILEDVYLYLRETDLSADVDGLAFTGVAMNQFSTMSDGFETGDSLIQRLLRYGGDNESDDTTTFGLCIYGGDEASDGLPKAFITPHTTDDYEYVISPADRRCKAFNPEESESELYNYIVVQYEDESGRTRYITPDDYATLKDDASISRYGKRMLPNALNAGTCDAAAALRMGRRALAFHKDLLDRMSLTVQSTIETKEGLTVPVCTVRSGERVRVKGYKGGKTYFIRNTGYTAEGDTITITSDLPPLMLELLVNRPTVE